MIIDITVTNVDNYISRVIHKYIYSYKDSAYGLSCIPKDIIQLMRQHNIDEEIISSIIYELGGMDTVITWFEEYFTTNKFSYNWGNLYHYMLKIGMDDKATCELLRAYKFNVNMLSEINSQMMDDIKEAVCRLRVERVSK